MHPSELFQLLAGLAERSQDVAIEVHFVDAALVRVGGVKHLVRPGGDADGPRGTDVGESLEKLSITVEDLDEIVLAVSDIDVAVRVGGDGVYGMELARFGATLAPFRDPVAVLVI